MHMIRPLKGQKKYEKFSISQAEKNILQTMPKSQKKLSLYRKKRFQENSNQTNSFAKEFLATP